MKKFSILDFLYVEIPDLEILVVIGFEVSTNKMFPLIFVLGLFTLNLFFIQSKCSLI